MKKNEQKTIAIDFDGVIHDRHNPVEGYKMCPPVEDAVDSVRVLKKLGYRIVVFCFWADCEKNVGTIKKWLKYFDCPYDEVTNIKPDAVAYIDNKGIRFNNWRETLQIIFQEKGN